jgi:hypothetical protein
VLPAGLAFSCGSYQNWWRKGWGSWPKQCTHVSKCKNDQIKKGLMKRPFLFGHNCFYLFNCVHGRLAQRQDWWQDRLPDRWAYVILFTCSLRAFSAVRGLNRHHIYNLKMHVICNYPGNIYKKWNVLRDKLSLSNVKEPVLYRVNSLIAWKYLRNDERSNSYVLKLWHALQNNYNTWKKSDSLNNENNIVNQNLQNIAKPLLGDTL